MYICEFLGAHHDETSMSKNVHSLWTTCEVSNLQITSVAETRALQWTYNGLTMKGVAGGDL